MSFLLGKNVTDNLIQNNKNAYPSPNKNSENQNSAQNHFSIFSNGNKSIKRASLFPLHKKGGISVFKRIIASKWINAGMTLEAALVLPLMFFFLLNIASSIEMMRLHGNLELALWETGNRMAVYGHILDDGDSDSDSLIPETGTSDDRSLLGSLAGIAFSYIYVRNEIIDYLGEEYLVSSPLSHGTDGLNFLETTLLGTNDCIDLTVTYQVSGPFSIPGFSSFRMANRYYGKAWTGYEIVPDGEENSTNEDYVYITETGSVYHETRECSHLDLQIEIISVAELPNKKNAEGRTYTECLICREENPGSFLYIAEYGDRYHYIRECSGLKRTIFMIERSEAGAYRPCSRCAGGLGGQ